MDQHNYVRECLEFYWEGGWSPEKGWEEAHYPAPKNQGHETIWMQHDHHQVQGLLQSREYGQCCFYNGDVHRFLTEGPFVPGWFELWDIYDEYKGENGRKTAELGIGIHAPGKQSKGGKKGGTKTAELGVGIHAPGMQSKGSKTTNSQKWQSTDPNHPPFITNPGNLTKWQKARGIDTSMRVKLQ